MPTRNVNLTEHYDRFVAEQVGAGRFRNASEVMRAGLHLLEQQTNEEQEKLDLLRALAAKGFDEIDQGRGIRIQGDEQLSEFIANIGRRVQSRVKSRRQSG